MKQLNLLFEKGKAAEKYLEAEASGKETTTTSVHTMNEVFSMVKKNLKLGDAIHYITMKKKCIEEIVTDDSHFNNVEGIKRIDILKLKFE